LGEVSFSQEIVTTEVKGWITKNSVPKQGDSQENRCIIHHPTGYPSGYYLNFFFFF
jgi:hypothetical protein